MSTFDSKDPSEKVVLTFDFSGELSAGETLSGSPTITIASAYGADASPTALINGAAALDTASTRVLQGVQGGLDGVDYTLKVVCATTNSKKVLARTAILPVRSS